MKASSVSICTTKAQALKPAGNINAQMKSTEVQNPRLLSMTRALCSVSIDDFTLAMRTPLGV